MSHRSGPVPRREELVNMAGGFALLPEKSGQRLSFPNNQNDTTASRDDNDRAQIAATLETLNQPRSDTTDLTYGTPGEKKDTDGRAMSPDDGRKRTQYYEDQFLPRDGPSGPARDRILRDSPVIADLRTNVIVRLIFF